MSPPCPEPMELFQWLDGEATANRARHLEAHLAGCQRCRRELSAQQRLVARLSEPLTPPDERDVQAVMARIRTQPPLRHTPWKPVWHAALAAACLLALGVALWRVDPKSPPEQFAARGERSPPSLHRHVGVDLLSAGQPPVLLRPGAVLPPTTPLFARYRNLGELPAFLLLFAQDAAGELHWLYPAYLTPGDEPRSIALPPTTRDTPMPEAVVLERPAAGPLQVFALVSSEPIRVLDVEGLGQGPLTEALLRARWPEAALTHWTLMLEQKP
ncbi:MAG: zf-HC2 domain-containing protein [Myxococcaceae bacterium]|nr:zf-HC2 domain-containing protein [Myxococcaceae bacterium]